MTPGGLRTYFLQLSLNILLSLLLLCALVAIGLHYYRLRRETVTILAHVASAETARVALRYHYAMTGDWPADADAVQYPIENMQVNQGFQNSPIVIQDGTLQLSIEKGPNQGEVISLRPAYPTADPAGPVHWVVGPGTPQDWRTIHGPDISTINPEKILILLR